MTLAGIVINFIKKKINLLYIGVGGEGTPHGILLHEVCERALIRQIWPCFGSKKGSNFCACRGPDPSSVRSFVRPFVSRSNPKSVTFEMIANLGQNWAYFWWKNVPFFWHTLNSLLKNWSRLFKMDAFLTKTMKLWLRITQNHRRCYLLTLWAFWMQIVAFWPPRQQSWRGKVCPPLRIFLRIFSRRCGFQSGHFSASRRLVRQKTQTHT